MPKFDNVSVTKKANVYFDGKCVSAPDSAPWNGRGGKGRRTACYAYIDIRGEAAAPAQRLAPSESQPYTVHFADGSRKSVGVIFPSKLTFKTSEPELMEITAGRCRVKLLGDKDWRTCHAGDSFSVPANSAFDIEALETLDYVCHVG